MIGERLSLLILLGVSIWLARQWMLDYEAALAGTPRQRPLPGATPASLSAIAVAAIGALCILAAEAGGEHVLGVSAEQSTMTALFGLYSVIGAPVIEEIVFRGYLVIEDRGWPALWASVVTVSLLFALLHPFLWEWHGTRLTVHLTGKAWFSTAAIFAGSLWFYAVRFVRLNPRRSLLPCLVAHATKNLGVLAIKYLQGFLGGWW